MYLFPVSQIFANETQTSIVRTQTFINEQFGSLSLFMLTLCRSFCIEVLACSPYVEETFVRSFSRNLCQLPVSFLSTGTPTDSIIWQRFLQGVKVQMQVFQHYLREYWPFVQYCRSISTDFFSLKFALQVSHLIPLLGCFKCFQCFKYTYAACLKGFL